VGSFSGVEEMQALAEQGIEPLLAWAGVSVPAASPESPTLKLLVQPEYRTGLEHRLRGSPRFEFVIDPKAANFVIGNQDFVQKNRSFSPKAVFFQVGDSAAVLIITEQFLLVISSQKDQLRPGAVLVVGMQIGSEGAVLFEYL
jgi:hypothetical protein